MLLGERYKNVTKEFKGLVRGEYGTTPAPIDPAFVEKILGKDADLITERPADALAPEMDKLREKCKAWTGMTDEDVLSYALFEQVTAKFFDNREKERLAIDGKNADASLGIHAI